MLRQTTLNPGVPVSVTAEAAPLHERLAFIRKVYSLLSISLLMAIVACTVTLTNTGFLAFVAQNMMIFAIGQFGVLIASNFIKSNATLSFGMMSLFVILSGITVAPIVYVYADVALMSALTTLAVFFALTVYTFVSRKDFSFIGKYLFVAIIAMVVIGLLNAFWFKSSGTQMVMAGAGVLVFSGFILFETSNIMRVYPTTMAVQATLGLYISILNLFISLLQIFGGRRS